MDLIYAGRYTEVCDYAWGDYNNPLDTMEELPSGIWHVDTASIPEFFSAITNIHNRKKKYVVVSPSCDFGVCEQKYNHPALDLEKWLSLQITPRHGYNDLQMQARINRERCRETDRYSIKCWSYTEATFPKIPDNVIQWFLVNCEINNARTVAIPFGVYGNKNLLDGVNLIEEKRKHLQTRDRLLYVNFQFYNTNRSKLYNHFQNMPGVTCKRDCSFDEYLDDLATHKYVLCPTGNGLDCYRTLETIYMGAIPILENSIGALVPYEQLKYPMLQLCMTGNLFKINVDSLEQSYDRIMDAWNTTEIDISKALWPYWKQRIEKCLLEL